MIDFGKLDNIELQNIFTWDYPDFSDAYISYAEIDGVALTDEELDAVNDNGDFIYSLVINKLF